MSGPDRRRRAPRSKTPAARLAAEGGRRRRSHAARGGRAGGRRRAQRRKSGGSVPKVSVLAVLVFLLIFAGAGGYVFLNTYISPPDYSGRGHGAVVIEVEQGAALSEIGTALEKAGVVKSERAFTQAAAGNADATGIQPGHYELRRRMEASLALKMLLDPSSRVQARVTIPEGQRLSQILRRIAKKTDIPPDRLKAAAKDPGSLGLPAYAKNLEGYVFPATYRIGPDDTAQQVLTAMVDRFEKAANAVNLKQRARARDASLHEIVTIASLIQGEARRDTDLRKVSAVVYNRLDKGMKLQFDSTVNYALGQSTLQVSTSDTEVDSPYNTYRHEGLPPGPINSPGQKALEAALNPANGNWLWFVTTNPQQGITKFTDSYEEFQRFKAEFERNTNSG